MKRHIAMGFVSLLSGFITYKYFNHLWFDNIFELKLITNSPFRERMFETKFIAVGICCNT